MAYTRTQWVEQETPLSAQNMNNIEDGIEELQSQKVDKVSGKALSDNNYTAAEKTKLAGIEAGAEVNVQPDWNQSDTSADDYIKNKPGNASSSTAGLMSAADKTKLDGVQAGAQVNRTYTAVTGKPTAAVSPGFGGPIIVSQVAQDANGQVSVTDRTITIPSNDATTSAHGLMSASDKLKLNKVSIRTAAAVATKNFTIDYRETVKVVFKYKNTEDRFDSADIVVPMAIPQLSTGLAINSFEHSGTYFNIWITNAHPTSRTVTANTEITLLVIDNEVS